MVVAFGSLGESQLRMRSRVGTAEWFLRSSVFKKWKSTGSLWWISGKRTFFSTLRDLTGDGLPS